MNCINCIHVDFKTYPSHTKAGISRCKLVELPGVFENFIKERQCGNFVQADAKTIKTRMDWWDKEKSK